MIDLQTAADGIGRLRVRHVGGTEGVLSGIEFSDGGPLMSLGGGPRVPVHRPQAILTAMLADGGKIEAPQASFEVSV